jgi:hypothetical protein
MVGGGNRQPGLGPKVTNFVSLGDNICQQKECRHEL